MLIWVVLSSSKTDSSVLDVDDLAIVSSDLEESLSVPSPVGSSWSSPLLRSLSVGSGSGVTDGPSLVDGSVHVIQAKLNVVGSDITTSWLDNLIVHPEEGSVEFDFGAVSSGI